MYTLISIFYIALVGMAFMIFMKRRELLSGKQSIVSRAGAGVDHIFQAVFAKVKKVWSHVNKDTFMKIGHWLAFHALFHTRKVYVEVKDRTLSNPQGKKLLDAVRGRGEVATQGSSLYLRRLSK